MPILTDAARSVTNLIDSWAVRFMEEMDYTLEANNADRFAREMSTHKSLGSAVRVPTVSEFHMLGRGCSFEAGLTQL